jgi:hypothetical protein
MESNKEGITVRDNLIDQVHSLLSEWMGEEFTADMDEEMLINMALQNYKFFLEEQIKNKAAK